MAENIGKLKASLNKKKVYFDYLLKLYETFDDRKSIKHAFAQSVKSPGEAEYILNRAGDELSPPITFNLIMIKGDEDSAISFGKVHYKKYPEIAVNLSGIYIKRGKRKEAIETAEKALHLVEKEEIDLYDSVLTEHRTALRMFLDKCYIPEVGKRKYEI
jgi:tetratricopeptide (TPR) repeat protein